MLQIVKQKILTFDNVFWRGCFSLYVYTLYEYLLHCDYKYNIKLFPKHRFYVLIQ